MLRWSAIRRIVRIPLRSYSTANPSAANIELPTKKTTSENDENQSKMVAAAFASLREITIKNKNSSLALVYNEVNNAKDVESLLTIVENHRISRQIALEVVSKLTNWTSSGRIKPSEFETDVRFAKICRILGRPVSGASNDGSDLSVILDVTMDDQAVKLISALSLSQMVKVLSSLCIQKRRSTPILRSLSFNIGKLDEPLNIKEASDVFYACAKLNFPDEVLLNKVAADSIVALIDNKAPSVVSSIATSAGILKYRDIDLFENLTDWMVNNSSLCRPKEYISLVLALANVNFVPEKFPVIFKFLKPQLNEKNMSSAFNWLDIVWALVALDKYELDFISSVLNPEFLNKLKSATGDLQIVTKMKILNINGFAKQLGPKYKGALLPEDSNVYEVPLLRMKEKQVLVNSIMETLSNIIKIEEFIKTNVDIRMGFIVDIEFRVSSTSRLMKLSEPSQNGEKKVAIMVCNYHDLCRGSHDEPNGITALNHRLLKNMGYELITVSFNEFDPQEKLMDRMLYLENKMKNIVTLK